MVQSSIKPGPVWCDHPPHRGDNDLMTAAFPAILHQISSTWNRQINLQQVLSLTAGSFPEQAFTKTSNINDILALCIHSISIFLKYSRNVQQISWVNRLLNSTTAKSSSKNANPGSIKSMQFTKFFLNYLKPRQTLLTDMVNLMMY